MVKHILFKQNTAKLANYIPAKNNDSDMNMPYSNILLANKLVMSLQRTTEMGLCDRNVNISC